MNSSQLPLIEKLSLATIGQRVWRYLTGWRGFAALAAVALAAGLTLNWSWLVAAGIAPLLISAAPCIAMCALGLCMKRMTGRKCATDDAAADGAIPALPSRSQRGEKGSDVR